VVFPDPDPPATPITTGGFDITFFPSAPTPDSLPAGLAVRSYVTSAVFSAKLPYSVRRPVVLDLRRIHG
jgi:hypothetical protein